MTPMRLRAVVRFRMHYSKLVGIPVEKSLTLSLRQFPKIDDEKGAINNVLYATIVGSLMFIGELSG